MGGSSTLQSTGFVRMADNNLHLALLDECHDRASWLAEREADYEEARGAHPTWPTWNALRQQEKGHNVALEEYLIGINLPLVKLHGLEELVLDGDRDLYGWIFPYWWEKTAHFAISSLEGLEHCANLSRLRLTAKLVRKASLAPLAKLSKLERLSVEAAGELTELEALLDVPKLSHLEVVGDGDDAEWKRVIDALKKRGLSSVVRRSM